MWNDFQILSSKQIDRKKWANCVENNDNGLIYANAVFLDYMSPSWEAIIFDDYKAVFPLCINKKYGLKYLQTPFLGQQLGLIGQQNIPEKNLLNIIHRLVKYGTLSFNFSNQGIEKFGAKKRTNFILDLNRSYESIYQAYKKDLKNNLKKATKATLQIAKGNAEKSLDFYQSFLYSASGKDNKTSFERFKNLLKDPLSQNAFFAKDVFDAKNNLLSTGLFLKDNKRIYNIATTIFEEGKKLGAVHFLLDSVIREFQNSSYIFDFEGSDLPGVKSFYENFSPTNQPYFQYHFNNLPFPLNKIKR